jgi:hypothetical protein
MSRKCENSADKFCYICGEFTTADMRCNITSNVKKLYHAYFGYKLGDQDKPFAPHIACQCCTSKLRMWSAKKLKSLPFGIPMVWREQQNHHNDCYFCLTNIQGFNKKNKDNVIYPNLRSANRPVPHSDEVPIPIPAEAFESSESDSSEDIDENAEAYQPTEDHNPRPLSQAELNDLTRDLHLPKESAQLLGSRLREHNLLAQGTTYAWYRHREKEFLEFFEKQGALVFCNEIQSLVEHMGIEYKPDNWRLFIDSSSRSLKAVLLFNGNLVASIPVGHSVQMSETYENMQILITALKYHQHNWLICGDLKVIAILLGLQGGYTKYPCFLCLWDSRADDKHFVQRNWPARLEFLPGTNNVRAMPLVDPKKVLLPPLHIKLGLMKIFVKALNKDSEAFKYLAQKFPHISEAKLKAGIFVGPQIRELLKDPIFENKLVDAQIHAWFAFKAIVQGFLGNFRSPQYKQIVQDTIDNFHQLGCRMSVKMHFLNSHLDYFPDNCGNYSEEQGERFHQDITIMEQRYQGQWNVSMMADYCWSLKRDVPDSTHKRKPKRQQFLSTT